MARAAGLHAGDHDLHPDDGGVHAEAILPAHDRDGDLLGLLCQCI
jgi:hypothetical protein